jgi:hypothetical protein
MQISFIEGVQLLMSSGVLAGGIGFLKWTLRTERRLIVLEVKNGIEQKG